MEQSKFREDLLSGGEKGLKVYTEWLEGKREGSPVIEGAKFMISSALKVEHMNQIAKFTERSQAMRLAGFIRDSEDREKYIRLTNPEMTKLLINKPKR